MNDLVFLVPLGNGSHWDNNELRYMLRSLDANVKCDFRVVVCCLAEELPAWLVNTAWLEAPPRPKSQAYENYIDTLHKLELFALQYANCESFVYVYDDCLLMKEVQGIKDFKNIPLHVEHKIDKRYGRDERRHAQTVYQSLKILRSNRPNLNDLCCYETHIPRRYNRSKLRALFEEFPISSYNPPYAPATMYFNLFPEEVDVRTTMVKNNPWKAGFYFDNVGTVGAYSCANDHDVNEAVNGKMYVQWSDRGLSTRERKTLRQPLKEFIMRSFPNKSRFEL